MTIGTNNSSLPAGSALGSTPSFASTFDVGLVFYAVAGRIASVIINLYTTFYYGKAAIAEDLTSLKLYMKESI